jgi:hypothetical protein
VAPSKIQTFEFQDVSLSAALIVPDDDRGVEMLTSLRPEVDQHSNEGEQWSFSVTSVVTANGDDVFTEHCHGKIGYTFESRGSFSDSYFIVRTNERRFTGSSHLNCHNFSGSETNLPHQMV